MNNEQRQLMLAIGTHGISPEQLADRFGRTVETSDLIARGYISLEEIALFETIGPGAAPAPPIRYFALTPRGAQAIGLDPRLLAA